MDIPPSGYRRSYHGGLCNLCKMYLVTAIILGVAVLKITRRKKKSPVSYWTYYKTESKTIWYKK